MNKEDRNNFQKCIEEILEDLNLGRSCYSRAIAVRKNQRIF